MQNGDNTLIKVTDGVKDILQLYDTDDLISTIPNDYKIFNSNSVLQSYEKCCKPTQTSSISLTEPHKSFITTFAENANVPFDLVFNFLIECVADCGKINTRQVNRALNFYYDAAISNPTLHKEILDAFADSVFYSDNRGLNDKDIAEFLIISAERTKNYK